MYKKIKKGDIENEYVNKVGVSGRVAAKCLGITYKTFISKLKELKIDSKKRKSKYIELNDKKWIYDQYFVQKKSISKIADEICASNGAVNSAIRWAGLELRSSEEGLSLRYPNGRYSENSSNWKGGRRNGGKDGRYTMILRHNHPQADSSGYVMEHRLVIEEKLGRILTKDEIVHHLDGNGHNNDIFNLQLTTRKKHFKDHFDAVKELKRLQDLLKENNIAY